jgi:hypothetical protein
MPPGVGVSGLESDGGDQFFCGGGSSGKVRTVRRPRRGSAAGSGSEIPVDSTGKQSKRPSRGRFAEALREAPGRQGVLRRPDAGLVGERGSPLILRHAMFRKITRFCSSGRAWESRRTS